MQWSLAQLQYSVGWFITFKKIIMPQTKYPKDEYSKVSARIVKPRSKTLIIIVEAVD